MRQSIAKTAISLVLWVLLSWPVSASAGTWQAGAAKRAITPTAPMWMAGYAHRDHPAEGQLTELWAKALCLQDESGSRGVVITLDLIGIDRALSQAICQQVIDKYGLTRSQIALCTSHTHTGPVVARNLQSMHYALLDEHQRALVEQYSATVLQQIVEVVGEAVSGAATGQRGVGQCSGHVCGQSTK